MAISYNKLWKLLIDKKMTQAELRKAANIAPTTGQPRLRLHPPPRNRQKTLIMVKFRQLHNITP